jgi:hypothetical protein
VRGTKLEPVGFSPPISALQCFWRHCESKLVSPSEEEEGPNEDVENDMLITVCHVSRLVAFDLVPAHRWLAAELVSHFTQHGKKVSRNPTFPECCSNAPRMFRKLFPQNYVPGTSPKLCSLNNVP